VLQEQEEVGTEENISGQRQMLNCAEHVNFYLATVNAHYL
jgi:hypothetical protein